MSDLKVEGYTQNTNKVQVYSVEITDEYIDMYDVCNTDDGYYVANGVITHNTAADIYKIAVNNMFERICKEGWLGKVLINGFIHDELLMEVHKSINPYYFFKVWKEDFEVKPANYCRLFAGAGVGTCWYDAKKIDLPTLFIEEIIEQYDEDMEWNENLDEFIEKVKYQFKKHKTRRIRDYILDSNSQGDIIKPAVGSLLEEEVEIILSEVSKDENLVEKYNAILVKNKLVLNEKVKVKDLQEQLRIYCLYNDISYEDIDIKSVEEGVSLNKNSSLLDEEDDDVVTIEIDKEELLTLGLITSGIIIDHETRTIHMAEIWINSEKGYIQGTKQFIEKYMIVEGDNGYKIMYYPNLKGSKPEGNIIPNYCVPFENGSVLMHYYKEMISRQFARLVR